jgi:hypothetical protein
VTELLPQPVQRYVEVREIDGTAHRQAPLCERPLLYIASILSL